MGRNAVSNLESAGVCVLALVLMLPACSAQPPEARPIAFPLLPVATVSPVRVEPGPDCGIRALRENMLRELNTARAKGRSCGARRMPPTAPLAWNDALSHAAASHSADMARRDYFGHATPEGKRVGARVSAEGYRWRSVGENIAGGDRSVEIVMRGWMDSPGHCANIMNPEFSDIGAACVERPGTTWGTYWTMVLGGQR
jgi:uncharacterized protein YkwD